jgi:hypothetical protein
MASYIQRAMASKAGVTDVVSDALQCIEMLDHTVQRLSHTLDNEVAKRIRLGLGTEGDGGGKSKGKGKGKSSKKPNKGKDKDKGKGKRKMNEDEEEEEEEEEVASMEELRSMRDLLEDLTDRKSSLATRAYDVIDHCTKIIDDDVKQVEQVMTQSGFEIPPLNDAFALGFCSSGGADGSGGAAGQGKGGVGKGKAIAANEPIYCVCRQVAFGEMVSCDNEDCEIEWFHYPCVGLTKEPKNQWFCPWCVHIHQPPTKKYKR